MKRRLRQRQILELLQAEPELDVATACERLGASQATVRREFAQLAKEGRVEKTWGGIRMLGGEHARLAPPAFAARLGSAAAEKIAIARAAAELLKDGDVVMIDGGTTTLQLADFIARKRIRVITNSLVIAHAIDEARGSTRGAEVYLAGGRLEPGSGFVAGAQAEAFLRRFNADWAFLSAAGVDEKAATNYNEAVLASECLMIEQSAKIALLVDHTKLGKQAMCKLCPTAKVDRLITDKNPASRAMIAKLKRAGVHVIEVEP